MSGQVPDVAVIGGGIVGTCVALQLQRSGRKVTVLERGIPGNEASGHNGGMFSGDCMPVATPEVIRSLPKLLTDPESPLVLRKRYLPWLAPWLIRFALASRRVETISIALSSLSMRGFDAYRPLVVGTEAEAILGNRGYVYGYEDRSLLDIDSEAFALRRKRGVAFEVVESDRLATLVPTLVDRLAVGVYFPNAFYTKDPRAFTQALLADFMARGGTTRRAQALGFESRGGRVQRVRTDDGDVTAGTVVIAAGPWSRRLLGMLGTDVPLEVERGYGIDLPNPGLRLDLPIVLQKHLLAITPLRDGIRVLYADELASISAPADPRIHDRFMPVVRHALPELKTDGASTWMRQRPSTPDSLPIIGRAPRSENTYLAFGHGHKGLGMGAITGKLVQEIMDGQPTSVNVAPFSPTRFSLRKN